MPLSEGTRMDVPFLYAMLRFDANRSNQGEFVVCLHGYCDPRILRFVRFLVNEEEEA